MLNSVKLSSECKSADWWDELTENDRLNILNGIKDYQKGNTLESNEFWNGLANG